MHSTVLQSLVSRSHLNNLPDLSLAQSLLSEGNNGEFINAHDAVSVEIVVVWMMKDNLTFDLWSFGNWVGAKCIVTYTIAQSVIFWPFHLSSYTLIADAIEMCRFLIANCSVLVNDVSMELSRMFREGFIHLPLAAATASTAAIAATSSISKFIDLSEPEIRRYKYTSTTCNNR